MDNVEDVERVSTEVQALTALRHPHIIELIEVIFVCLYIWLAVTNCSNRDIL